MKKSKVKNFINASILASFCLLVSSWTTPVTISGTGTNGAPTVSVNDSSNSVVVWVNGTYPNLSIQSASYDGTSWSSFVTISNTGTCCVNPFCQIDGSGNAIAAWEIIDSGTRSINIAEMPAGSTWQSPVTLSTSTYSSGVSVAMNASGQIIVGWADLINGSIQAVTSTFGGAWSSISNILTDTSDKGYVQVGIDAAGNGLILWQNLDDYTISVSSTTAGFGSTWSTPIALSSTGTNTGALLNVDPISGNAIAAWCNMDTAEANVNIYESGVWGTATIIAEQCSTFPVGQVNGTDYYASWLDYSSNSNAAINSSGTWETPVVLSLNNPNDMVNNTAFGGVLTTCWLDYTTNQITVSDYDGTTTTTPVEISSAELAVVPQVASSSSNTVAVWQAYSGADNLIQVNIN